MIRIVRCCACYGSGESGSLITVDLALEQGREVYALPGPVNSRMVSDVMN
ncbi:MAG: DNA-processing protein DprA [Anaerobutyricum sp.]